MTETIDTVMAQIRGIAEAALRQTGTPQPVTQALQDIIALTKPLRDDSPGASDLPRTDNQTL